MLCSEVADMAGSFAGSKSLGERRRRRLAADADPFAANPAGDAEADQDFFDEATHHEPATARFPLQKLISRQPWKHWVIGLVASFVAAALIWTTHSLGTTQGPGNPGTARLFDPAVGSVLPFFNSVLLFVSGQLALLVFWARTQSRRDFQGQYEIWAWMAGACFLFAGGLATGAHTAWSETVNWLWAPRFWRKDVLCWLAPTVVVALAISKPLRLEFRGCRTSSILLHLTACCWAAVAMLTFQPALLTNASLVPVITSSLLIAGNVLLLTGMLHHACYVIYVNAEPPPLRASWLVTLGRKILSVVARRKTKQMEPPVEDTPTAPSPTTRRSTPRREVRIDTVAVEPERDEPIDQDVLEEDDERPESEPWEAETSHVETPPPIQRRVDPPVDPEDLKGLSKKERRRLRKQRRDAQRTAYDDDE